MRLILLLYLFSTTLVADDSLKKLSVDQLINLLPNIENFGFGYSSMYSGSGFLPVKESGKMSMGVVGKMRAASSNELTEIVSRGAKAIPFLIKHMNDSRPIKIKPLKAMMWMDFSDEYDYNRRTLKEKPKYNEDNIDKKHPQTHQLTVGDICFVALGQIVNRSFNASRYQPTGGLIVNSPTYSKDLYKIIINEYAKMGEHEHKQQLINDIYKPDYSYRRSTALLRLKYYYPESVETVVLDILETPRYDSMATHSFIRKELYSGISKQEKQKLLEEKVKQYGKAFKDGVLIDLFDDLDTQIADEEGRLHPPLDPKYDSRNCLMQLYSYPKGVKSHEIPYADSWRNIDLESFIKTMTGLNKKKVNTKVFGIFSEIKDDDELALICIHFLKGKGYNLKLRAFCEKRIKDNSEVKEKFSEIIKTLQAH